MVIFLVPKKISFYLERVNKSPDGSMNEPKINFAIAIGSLILWLALTFGLTLETGWVHLALGSGVIFLARAIIVSGATPEE